MVLILSILILALILGGLGFAVHVLWWFALIVFVAWAVGFGFSAGELSGGGRRWYRRRYGRWW